MRKAAQLLLCIGFLAAVCLPGLLSLLTGGGGGAENREKRTLAEFPDLAALPVRDIPASLESYFNDHLPWRSELVAARAAVDRALGTSSNADVLAGRKGWLFYRKVTDGDPISGYLGRDLFSEAELEAIAQKLQAFQNCLEENGADLVLFIPPNKERMYSEYMPEGFGEPAANSAARQLTDYLRENTLLEVVWAEDVLREAKGRMPEDLLYYRLDSHWNDLGAYIGTRALLSRLGIELPPVSQLQLTAEETTRTERDLYDLLGRTDNEPDRRYTVRGYARDGLDERSGWDLMPTAEEFNGPARVRQAQGDRRRLVLIRDSFGTAMVPYVASCFRYAAFTHLQSYDREALLEEQPNLVVLELVERNLHRLLDLAL